jgi:hypothetical protein
MTINVSYFYISTLRSIWSVYSMAVFCSSRYHSFQVRCSGIIIIIIIIIIEQKSVMEKRWNNKCKVVQHYMVKVLNMINNDASFLSECIKFCFNHINTVQGVS